MTAAPLHVILQFKQSLGVPMVNFKDSGTEVSQATALHALRVSTPVTPKHSFGADLPLEHCGVFVLSPGPPSPAPAGPPLYSLSPFPDCLS